MASEIATAYVTIAPEIKNFAKDVKTQIGQDSDIAGADAGKGFAGGMGKVLKGAGKAIAVGAASIAVAAGAAIVKGIKGWSELEQNLGGNEATFGKYAKNVEKISRTAATDMGLTQSDFLASSTKIGSLMQGSGISAKKSADLTATAMQRAADVASVMGIDTASAMEAITGAAKGNFTMMDNLGVAMNATELAAYAQAQGINKSYKEMSQAEKVGLAYQMFLDKTSKYAGNYAKENDTLSGSIGSLKAAYSDLLTGMAGGQDELVKSSVEGIITILPGLLNNIVGLVSSMVPKMMEIIPGLLTTLLPQLVDLFNQIVTQITTMLPSLIQVIVNLIPQIVTNIVNLLPLLIDAGIKIVISLMEGLAQMLPTLIPQIIDGALKMVDAILDNLPAFIDAALQIVMALATGLIDALPKLIAKIPVIVTKLISTLIQNLPAVIDGGVKLLLALVDAIPKFLPTLIEALPTIITAIVEALVKATPQILAATIKALGGILSAIPKVLVSILSAMANVGLNLVQGLWNGIKDAASWVLDKIKGFGKSILNGIKSIFGIKSPSKETAEIGEYLSMGLAKGITEGEGYVTKAVGDIAEIIPGMSPELSVSPYTASSAFTGADGGTSPMAALLALIEKLYLALKDLHIEMDRREIGRVVMEAMA